MHTYLPTDENVRILGRTVRKTPLPLFWTASGIEFDIKGTVAYVNFTTDYMIYEQWIRVEVNGFTVIRMMLDKGDTRVCLFRGCDPETVRHIRIFKEVQAMPTDELSCLLIDSIETNGQLLPLKNDYRYKIEFIGDSLTSGEGLSGTPDMMEWVPGNMSTRGNYAVDTAKALGAELSIVSQCGWGIFQSWDAHPEQNMPDYYEMTCGVLKGEVNHKLGAFEPWNFSAWQADAVVINLGTNDGSGFNGDFTDETVQPFVDKTVTFLKKIRSVYLKAAIMFAYGMCGDPMEKFILKAIDLYKNETEDQKVYYTSLPFNKDVGSRSHPGLLSHKESAEILIPALKKIL